LSYILIGTAALVVSGLTLFSGFGLGTALMPVFALFFPLEIAIAATAAVHLANNIVKAILVGRHADLRVTLRFSLPAIPAAFLGAWLLGVFSMPAPLFTYSLGGGTFSVTLLKLLIGALMAFFSFLELRGEKAMRSLPPSYIPLGGAISGFFGGLSGHQGAFRSAFLLRAGLSKEAFIGTTVLSAVMVDVARIAVYGATFLSKDIPTMLSSNVMGHVLTGMTAAFAGVFIGSRLIQKVTYRSIQVLVGVLLMAIAALLMAGLI
jgi:uncharacterized membrane protein YfcA